MAPTVLGMQIIHCDETASWLPLSSPSVAGSGGGGGGGVVLAWLFSESTSLHHQAVRTRWGWLFFCCCRRFCVFFKMRLGDARANTDGLHDCSLLLERLQRSTSRRNGRIWQKERRSPIYPPMNLSSSVRKSAANAVISFKHYYETSHLQQWSRHHRPSGSSSQPVWANTGSFSGRWHNRSKLTGAQQAHEATWRDRVPSCLSLIRVYQLCWFQNNGFGT